MKIWNAECRMQNNLPHNKFTVEFHTIFVDATEGVDTFLHIDRHLVVDARLTQELVVQGPEDGLLWVAVRNLEDDLLTVSLNANRDADLGIRLRVDELHHLIGMRSAATRIEGWQRMI